ncbi:hypothetical protein ARSEF1564_005074 [Beauveria bassiana]
MRNKHKSTVRHWIESRYFGLEIVGSFAVGVFVRMRERGSGDATPAAIVRNLYWNFCNWWAFRWVESNALRLQQMSRLSYEDLTLPLGTAQEDERAPADLAIDGGPILAESASLPVARALFTRVSLRVQ